MAYFSSREVLSKCSGGCCGYCLTPDLMSPSVWGWGAETIISSIGTYRQPWRPELIISLPEFGFLVLNTIGVVSLCLALPALGSQFASVTTASLCRSPLLLVTLSLVVPLPPCLKLGIAGEHGASTHPSRCCCSKAPG